MAVSGESRIFNPGDLIYKENAFARVLAREKKDYYCECCIKKTRDLIACKECRAVKYCSPTCMKKDWLDHQLECKYLKNLPKDIMEDTVRLIGKIILKVKGKNWKEIKTKVLDTEVCFDDIDPCYEKMTQDPMMYLRYKHIRAVLRNYIGEENLPEENELLKIVGKVVNNNNRGSTPDSKTLVECFFLGSSSFRRECIPNSNVEVIGHKIFKVWACKKISMESEQVSISQHSVLFSPPKKPFECKCTHCSLPYGESLLTRILNEDKAFYVIHSIRSIFKIIEIEPVMSVMPGLKDMINDLILEQNGVLAETNAMHIRLLGIKCYKLTPEIPKNELLRDLEKLEKIMSSIFGEYYLEMEPVYFALLTTYLQLENEAGTLRCMEKLKLFHIHKEDD